jgi:regulatory protein
LCRPFYFAAMAFKREPIHDLKQAGLVARKYCDYQERCHSEVVKRLRDMGLGQAACDNLLGELIIEGYLSESRFALAYASGKCRIKRWGPYKITHAMRQKHVDEGCITEALKPLMDEAFPEALQALMTRRLARIPSSESSSARKNNVWKYANTYGYAGDDIARTWALLKGG